ncbi:hypothetical protein [Halobacillus litoralis]|uniref:Uncharacterized protein n=1 Tax=Halobacillus litoralis TaxID=45668 RepID=A0A410MAZ2_9BACI|nr:hypothetical protein [Halobacillus litoralis]QAS51922.1 hypothetical protein HLI_06675 [Halobacillus litoralis]
MAEGKSWRDRCNPLYLPLVTVFPLDGWLLVKSHPFSGVEISLYIVGIFFPVFAGAVEIDDEARKHQVYGYIYLASALIFASLGLSMWLL